jgi:hypothetical protein
MCGVSVVRPALGVETPYYAFHPCQKPGDIFGYPFPAAVPTLKLESSLDVLMTLEGACRWGCAIGTPVAQIYSQGAVAGHGEVYAAAAAPAG